MKIHPALFPVMVVAAFASGCANDPFRPSYADDYRAPRYAPASVTYGSIVAIDQTRAGGVGAGAVIGGVVGGVLGHQLGSGRGRDAATVAGAVGGAVVGHEIEKRQSGDAYAIRVRVDGGGYLTVTQAELGDLRVGDRVRIENDRLSLDTRRYR